MIYTVSYTTPTPAAIALNATDAHQALALAREAAANGHTPTIRTKDNEIFSLKEFELVVSSVKFGDDA